MSLKLWTVPDLARARPHKSAQAQDKMEDVAETQSNHRVYTWMLAGVQDSGAGLSGPGLAESRSFLIWHRQADVTWRSGRAITVLGWMEFNRSQQRVPCGSAPLSASPLWRHLVQEEGHPKRAPTEMLDFNWWNNDQNHLLFASLVSLVCCFPLRTGIKAGNGYRNWRQG